MCKPLRTSKIGEAVAQVLKPLSSSKPCCSLSPPLSFPLFPCFLPRRMALPLPTASEFPRHVVPPAAHRIRLPHASMAIGAPEKKTRKKRQTKEDNSSYSSSSVSTSSSQVSVLEKSLRFTFMEELMTSARAGDVAAVSEIIYDMIAAGLSPGPRSFHGLIVAQTLSGDHEGAVISSIYWKFTLCFSFICSCHFQSFLQFSLISAPVPYYIRA